MVIASHIDGRLRIRDEQLKDWGVASAVRKAVASIDGIREVAINERVGSLLVLYDAAIGGIRRVIDLLGELLTGDRPLTAGQPEETPRRFATVRKLLPRRHLMINLGMLASLLLSMIGAIFDLKKLHIATGVVFLGLFGAHFFERKHFLFG